VIVKKAEEPFLIPTASSTWEQGDQYALGLDEALCENGVGQYGALL